ncbi:hypothetical protein EXS57_03760 [Candidatus Kaiserbacteria bacterium]|nr:hypothetical protein [Candidatus Kaiserbacteria bacterium]
MKTGILVHGPHLQAKGWEGLAWGKPPHQMGRIPKAIQMYFRLGAEALYFGTGASEKDGVKEGQYMFDTLFARKRQLGDFDALQSMKNLGGLDIHLTPNGPIIYARTQAEVIIDTVSQNTKEELLGAGDAFLARGITEIVLVSSATHMPRCLRDAQSIYNDPQYKGKYKTLAQGLLVAPADTCYEGADYDSTVIFEAPHRGDRPSYPLNEKARLLLKVKPGNLEEFGRLLQELVAEHS